MFDSVFSELAAVLFVSIAVGAAGTLLRQPLIVSFLLAGILVGPSNLDWVRGGEHLALLAEMGVALLLFVVGLRLDVHLIRSLGPVALATGLGQVGFTSGIGFALCLALGLDPMSAIYVAVALTFSSTIIIVKLLSDKKEIDSLHGRIAVGFLIVQDVVVVLAMIVLSAFGAAVPSEKTAAGILVRTLANGAVLLTGVGVLMRFVLPRLLRPLARSAELLVLSGITLALALAALGEGLGFSKEVGAFLAGVALASTAFRDSIASRLGSLRDFLLVFFFLELGAGLDLGVLGLQVAPALVLSGFVLVGNPLIVMIIMGLMGYRKRTGFLAGLTVAQISEFSLILAALGHGLGHLGESAVGLVTMVGLVTITLSTYLILYSHALYDRLAPWLSVFERRVPHREGDVAETTPVDALVIGLGRYGSRIARGLEDRGLRVLGVDFDPEAVAEQERRGLRTCYGDAEDPDLPASLPVSAARWVVVAIPGEALNLALARSLRQHGYAGRIAVTAHAAGEAERLAAVVDVILLPFADAAERAIEVVSGEAPASEPEPANPDASEGSAI